MNLRVAASGRGAGGRVSVITASTTNGGHGDRVLQPASDRENEREREL